MAETVGGIMEIQQLIGFYYVVQLKSFSKAAEATFRTQPALSLQIKKLETEVGASLLTRMGRHGVQPTIAGKRVYEFAKLVVEEKNRMLDELTLIKLNQKGAVSICAPLPILQFYLLDITEILQQECPEITLRTFHLNPEQCVEKVTMGDIDFGIVHDWSVAMNLKAVPWQSGEYMLMVPKGHELSKQQSITLTDITSYPLILPEKHIKFSARLLLDRACSDAGLNYSVVMETGNIILNAEYVSRGIGIACVLSYEPLRKQYADKVDFIPLDNIFPPQQISIIYKEGIKLSGIQESVLRFMLDHR